MEGKTCIFVCDRGFVIVGIARLDPDLAFHWLLSPGRTIRRWGTTDGLAQLCGGPGPETKMDRPCVRHIPFRAVLEIMEADEKAWEKHLST